MFCRRELLLILARNQSVDFKEYTYESIEIFLFLIKHIQ